MLKLIWKVSGRKIKFSLGELFTVIPLDINQKLFEEKRSDESQEQARKMILEAFCEMKKNPEKYARPFKTFIPKKKVEWLCVSRLEEWANDLGGHIADWVEMGLEWAQRIANGEKWENLCNNCDTQEWTRLIRWKDGYYAQIGGESHYTTVLRVHPASNVVKTWTKLGEADLRVTSSVPLITIYK